MAMCRVGGGEGGGSNCKGGGKAVKGGGGGGGRESGRGGSRYKGDHKNSIQAQYFRYFLFHILLLSCKL